MGLKLYVVIEHYPYEGYGLPYGIFSSREAAQAFINTNKQVKYFFYKLENVEIYEYELDKVEN